MTFSEVRQYQFGDDIRTIDWNVTARYNEPYVKVFEEERELTMVLMVDVSGSESFGTREQFKRDMITEISATLAFSAIQNNDKVGLLLFPMRSSFSSRQRRVRPTCCASSGNYLNLSQRAGGLILPTHSGISQM